MAEIYKSKFPGQEIDERLELIPELQEGVEAAQQAADGKYTKPASGIPMTDLSDEVREAIEEGGGQADWAQTDTTAPDYIKNKPSIPTHVVRFVQQFLSDSERIQARANIGAGTYTKPSGGIPESDLAPGVIPTVPTDVVKYSSQSLSDAQKTQARTNIGAAAAAALTALETAIAAKYTKPSSGIPETDLAANVQSALALARTSIQSLADYYDKTEIDSLLAAVSSEQYVDVPTLPTASASTLGKIYLVGPTNGVYDRYYTSYDGTTYSWVGVGTTEINLANYATKAELNQLSQEAEEGVILTEQSPTEIQRLQINYTNTAFAYISDANLRTHYIPVVAGDVVRLTASHSEAKVLKYGFSTDVPATGVAVTGGVRLEQDSINVRLVSPVTGYFAYYCSINYFADAKIYIETETALGARVSGLEREVREGCSQYFDFYSTGINKEIPITGFGTKGFEAGVTKLGDIYFNTTTLLLRRAVSGETPMAFSYETVPPDNKALYVAPIGLYRYVNNVFTNVDAESLGLLGRIIKNSEDIGSHRHLNICLLGNSYTADAWRYVPAMLLDYGITCKIEFYYRGSGSLWDLDTQWTSDSQYDIANEDGTTHIRLHFSCDSRVSPNWSQETRKSAKDIIESGKWDIVEIQTRGNYSRELSHYYPYLQNVIDKIMTSCPYNFDLWWFSAYNNVSQNSVAGRNQESLDAQKVIYKAYPFAHIIPAASAVFGCQLDPTLADLGDSKYKHLYSDDNNHLQEGLPCYVVACVVVQSILQKMGIPTSVMGDQFRPTAENIVDLGMNATANGESTGVTEENCRKAQKEAVIACRSPFDIQPPIAPEYNP